MSLLFSTGVIASSGLGKAAPGMVLIKPTSITHSGTSASIGANGQVTFSAVTSLSLNGVFSADFDNYVVAYSLDVTSGGIGLRMRLRLSGTDATTNYTRQYLSVGGTSVTSGRESGSELGIGGANQGYTNGTQIFIYGPALAQPTATRNITFMGEGGAYIQDWANTHSTSTAYDGCTIFPSSSSVTGKLAVYGIRS